MSRQVTFRRRSKYGAVRTVVDGITFDSKAEARRYGELKLLEKAHKISGLCCHLRWPLFAWSSETDDGTQVATYEVDFQYVTDTKTLVVEDVKGVKTPVYRLKRKLFEANYPEILFREVT